MGVTKDQAVQNRERIVAAAERLFRQKGVDAVGLAELMKEAGFTQGGFYNHFASKEALVSEVIGKAVDEGQQQLGAAIAQSRRRGVDPLIRQVKWYLSQPSEMISIAAARWQVSPEKFLIFRRRLRSPMLRRWSKLSIR